MATLEKRLGDGIESAFKAGNALLNSILSGSGATLNMERTLADNVEADHSLIGWCKAVGRSPRPQRPAGGHYTNSLLTTFVYDVAMGLKDDKGQDNVIENVYQALVQTLHDAPTFFATHVTDTEGNMNVADGEIEIEPLVVQGTQQEPEYLAEVRITVWHKQAMTQ